MDDNNLNEQMNNETVNEQNNERDVYEADYTKSETEYAPQNDKWNNSAGARDMNVSKENDTMGIASMVLGIISVVSMSLCCIPLFWFVPFVCGVPGIVLGVMSMKNCIRKGFAIAGLTMSIVSIVLSVIMLTVAIILVATGNFEGIINEFDYSNMYI